mgnify:CR=1 FL=1
MALILSYQLIFNVIYLGVLILLFFSLGEFNGALGLVTFTAKQGPQAFFKGFIPAFVRLGPHTILTFIFLEQLRLNFGVNPASLK